MKSLIAWHRVSILLVLAVAVVLVSPAGADAGFIVQQGIDTMVAPVTILDVPLATNVAGLNNAFVMLHYFYAHTPGANAGVNSDDGMVSAYLWNNAGTSTVRFARSAGAVDIHFSWTVIECTDNEFAVYRGAQSWSGTTTQYSAPIGATVTGDNCMAWVNGTTSNDAGTTAVREAHFTADVGTGNQTTLNLRRYQVAATPAGTLRWIVVEFDPAKIGGFDAGEQTITTQLEAIPASWAINGCTKSRSLLLGQWRVSGDDGLTAHAIALRMVNNTTGEAYVGTSDNFNRVLRWYCIDFGPNVGNRYEGQVDNSGNALWATADQTLTPVADPARAVSYVTVTSDGLGTTFPRPMIRHWVASSTTLKIERDYAGQPSWIEWQVLELPMPVPNAAPIIAAGATQTSVSPVNRLGADVTVISAVFTDTDQPGVGAFTCTFTTREPNNSTELILVDNQPNGASGLTITDNGGGSYVASYTYDPADAQTLGLYDLSFQVSDGTDITTDGYANNLDELEINEVLPNTPPSVIAGAAQVSISPVNRLGANATVISTTFTDADQPGIGAFNCTFRIREPNNTTELTLVNNQPHVGGGLTITDNGGGSYTASYTYDPVDAQTLGLYDLYFQVSDGAGLATDDYAGNPDELEISEIAANNPPNVTAGITQVSVSPVLRDGTNTTVVSATFTDADQPGVGGFTCTFKIREPNNTTELTLVNNQPHVGGGLTITDNGGGSYTASYTYDPANTQTTGLYDLYFEVSDGTDTAIDTYANNIDELDIQETAVNTAPSVTPGATQVSTSPVNRFGSNTTTISATFSDADQPGAGSFICTFMIRKPDNTTEVILVHNVTDGTGGLTITDDGGGTYTANYTYDPTDVQTLGFYDLYFQVSDGTDLATDGYASNLNELEINEVTANNPPQVTPGAPRVSGSPVNRIGTNSALIMATFTDADNPGVGGFAVTIKIRQPDNSTELMLADNLSHGTGGLTIVDNSGSYTARYTYDPDDAQTVGLYDLYFQVSDGIDSVSDGYANNLDELDIVSVTGNSVPVLAKGITAATPGSVDRQGAGTTLLSTTFTDTDQPGIGAFSVSFAVRHPYNAGQTVIANALTHGTGGMTIIDNGGGSYTAQITWDPPANAVLGFYDLSCTVSDGFDQASDEYSDNPDELHITNAGENAPPVVNADATSATPSAVPRIGVNPTTIMATFTDADVPGLAAFQVTFKLRYPNDADEIVLASNVGDGVGGVTIADGGSGAYTASISWEPANSETLGTYDLYFHVTDGVDTSYDGFHNNLEELELYDAIVNNPPTIVGGATTAIPASITRLGSEYTMIQASFTDADMPGRGAFTVTVRVRDASLTEYTIVNAAGHHQQGLRIQNDTGSSYTASVLWDPPVGQVTGLYDLYFSVTDNNAATATDGYANNANELEVTATAILGDGNLLRRTNDAANCGGVNSACHNLTGHQSQDCLVCHTPHRTPNIYLVRDTIQTPNSGPKPVIFKTLGIGDPYNDPDPAPGDPNSGVMADDSDGVHTGVCEVCHTTTAHHRNDGTAPIPAHNNSKNCAGCHPHADGFAIGESNGGVNCTCHQDIFASMDSSAALSRHVLAQDSASYTTGASGMYYIKNCLTCHVDHDIFRPDLNPGFGQRASNLRVDYSTDPVQGSSTVLANSDYSAGGSGGLCLSCHSSATCSGCHSAHVASRSAGTQVTPPDVPTTWEHTMITQSEYDAATSAHNYGVPSTFTTDASSFNANCVKCHNDDMAKLYQSSANKFSLHGSTFRKILDSAGIISATNPLEEDFCFKCHSTTSNRNAGNNQDYYGVKAMSAASLRIDTDIAQTSNHPVVSFSGIHAMNENTSTMTRHVECADCHDPHAATNTDPLTGVTGVDTTGAVVRPATNSYEVCFKCHSDRPGTTTYVTRDNPSMNTRLEFGSSALSFHPITDTGKNQNVPSLIGGWTTSSIMTCEDCHGSATVGSAAGPHGSQYSPILKLRQEFADSTLESATVYSLCYSCHSRSSILGDNSFKEHDRHIRGEDTPCTVCHDPHGVASVSAGDGSHLINFDVSVCTPDPMSGRLEFIDDGVFKGQCYVRCHGKRHGPKKY